ncbi:MAG: WYL domain-containing protein [Gammaproteobacteria bacterium]|nr:WYL domain-containing protein [Gammaproteobacteria bacterium]
MDKNARLPNEIKWATRQRLQFIEVSAYYTGIISRSTLASAFGISDPAATKDLKLYNELAPDNLSYNPALFGFVPTNNFKPLFANMDTDTVLPMIASNLLSADNPSDDDQLYGITIESLPLPGRMPDKEVLSQIIRAIKGHKKLTMTYHSLSNRDNQELRIIEPHAIINNGLRWHLRAYNHDTYDFRDFVLSRIANANMLDDNAESSAEYDDDWMEIITIQLQPHPGLNDKQRLTLKFDYNMENDMIELHVRRALVAYVLQRMSVDTTKDHSLNPNAYQLIVVNRDEIEPFAGWAFL